MTKPGDTVYKKGAEYKSTRGDTLERPPLMKLVPKGELESEQRKLDRQWEDYQKQQSELRNEYRNQPARR